MFGAISVVTAMLVSSTRFLYRPYYLEFAESHRN